MALRRWAQVFAIVTPAVAAAQKPLVLTKPNAEYVEPFSAIASIRELNDGRVLVTDARERVVQLIDFRGSATAVGREGSGPGEYALPGLIVPLPGDSSAIYDAGFSRYLIIHPDGKPGLHFRPVPSARGSQAAVVRVRGVPRGFDARGNIYYQGPAFHENGAGVLTPSDSTAIIRFDRVAQTADTIAFVRLAKGHGSVKANPGGGVQVMSGLANPLVPRDDWVVLPDGRVAVVRADTYRIDFYTSPSLRRSGPAVPYEKIRVDADVRRMVEQEWERAWRNTIASARGRGAGSASAMGQAPTPPALSGEWPEVMPPFTMQAAKARPNGQIWVLRTQKPGVARQLYDVFDNMGRVIGQVLLPPSTSLIGFGRGAVYLVRSDDDGLQYLQRYHLPSDS